MNYWEIGRALEDAARAIKDMPLAIITNAEDDVSQKYERMTKTVEEMQKFVQEKIAALTELDEIHMNECERICKAIDERRSALRKAIHDVRYEDISRVKDLAEAIERLNRLNPADLEMIAEILGRRKSSE